MAMATSVTPRVFLRDRAPRLSAEGIEGAVAVIDENAASREHRVRHNLAVARGQARVSSCSVPTALARMLFYKVLLRTVPPKPSDSLRGAVPDTTRVVRVGDLNSPEGIAAVRDAGCGLVCLAGARILSARTIRALGVPIVNVHYSDPRLFRGLPMVVWEVLAGLPDILPTVHVVTERVDAGPILAQAAVPIRYAGGLAATTRATMVAAQPVVCDLLERVIRGYAAGHAPSLPFEPARLRTTPSVRETLLADRLCRRRSRSNPEAGAGSEPPSARATESPSGPAFGPAYIATSFSSST